MRTLIVGGTGFIGQALSRHLAAEGHEVTVLLRSPQKAGGLPAGIKFIPGDPGRPGPWQEQVAAYDLLINLAGASIFTRWNQAARQRIHDSRILVTRNLVDAMQPERAGGQTLINAGAAGYFGYQNQEPCRETAPPGDDFLARICVAWEAEAMRAAERGGRVVVTRFAVVLGEGGGALAKMLPAFRLGFGGRLGSGRQWFPWIHLADLLAIFSFLGSHPEINGPVNCAAPEAVTNDDLTRELGRVLKRPVLMPLPAWLLRLLLGEMSTVALEGNRMIPGVLTDKGFLFRFPTLRQALIDLLG